MAKIKPSKGAPYARILGVGGYRPTRVVPNEVILETHRLRPTSGSAPAPASRPGTGPAREETVAEMSIEAAGKAIADAGITRRADRRA